MRHFAPRLALVAGVLSCAGGWLGAQEPACPPRWVPTFGGLPGVSGTFEAVHALAVFDDGGGPALYVGGGFQTAGGVAVNNIARFDGTHYSSLGGGVGNELFFVSALAVFDDGRGPALYAGGYFEGASGATAFNLARWDGTSWASVGGSVNNGVQALSVFDDGRGPALYAAGWFTIAGGRPANRVARWDGSSWTPLGSGVDNTVYALTVFDDGSGSALYAAGVFALAGGVPASRVARWNGSSWAPVGGLNNRVAALTVFDDGSGPKLYAAGYFGGSGVPNRIACWNGSSWSALGVGLNASGVPAPHANALTVFDDGSGPALYVAGRFTRAGGMPANHIAKWNGTSWAPVASGLSFPAEISGGALALATFDRGEGPELYAGGTFTGAGGAPASGIARWNGARWAPAGRGANDRAIALAVRASGAGSELHAGGSFTSVGGVSANHIARWAGGRWTALGSGTNDDVHALAFFDDGSDAGPALHAGGSFTSADGVAASHVARWNGTTWTALGEGTDGQVLALAVFDEGRGPELYAGGSFASAGGMAASGVARWDGAGWTAVDSGLLGVVEDLAVHDDGRGGGPALYAGGAFERTGSDVAVNHVSSWDGSSWMPLADGMDDAVQALAIFDDRRGGGPALYAGGSFTSAGGQAAHHVARWNGASWTPLAGGVEGEVEVLAVFDDGGGPALYAGGSFTSAGGLPASHVARWDGTSWMPLAGGTSGTVLTLAVFDAPDRGGPALLVGGAFTSAIDSGDSFLARWQGCPDAISPVLSCPTSIAVPDPRPGSPGEIVTFTVTASDERDSSPSLVCVPPSGSLFPPGVTLVHCKATDAARNQSNCSFAVNVQRKQGQ